MPDEARDISADDCKQLELLLREQHEALMRDDFDAVDEKSRAIAVLRDRLLSGGAPPVGPRSQHVQALNEKVLQLLVAKKEMAAADLAAFRHKRDLNKSYRADNP
jgi:hypothetical protein